MKIYIPAVMAILALSASGCQKALEENTSSGQTQGTGITDGSAIPGIAKIHVTEDLAEQLLAVADSEGSIVPTKAAGFSLEGLDIESIETTFMIGGKFEARQREAGLHRWFTVRYKKDVPVSKASVQMTDIEGVEFVEPVLRVKSMSVEMNDPQFKNQWHYYNTGQNGFTAGVDIKLQEAWDMYNVFGNENVTVAIIDGGVDFSHPDLSGNLWTNEAELNGSSGRDDDGNGYRDDIHGYNFVKNSADVHGEEHGTHVAGTVAAMNNNGIGVCGVAGGRYPDQPGVRLMGIQIMDERYPDSGASIEKAFQYAADNGAVIAQNSWGYEEPQSQLFSSDKAAIDYFIKYAGTDENGNQTGPMKGGLVVFAAGNSAVNLDYPPAYDEVIAVASIGPYGKAAYYTNYGPWVDVCAPGGDQQANYNYGGVLSTIQNSGYAYLQGTSMACPHVSGVAALALSVMGGEGYTCDDLFDLIIRSTDESIYNYNPTMKGQLGSGIISTVLALSAISTEAPEAISTLDVDVNSNTIIFTADVPADPDNTKAYYYNVYYSKNSFSKDDHSNAEIEKFVIDKSEDAGDGLKRFYLSGLDFNTKYYFAVSASDFAGNESELTNVESATTGSNTAPSITADTDEAFVVGSYGEFTRTYTATDPDGHTVTLTCDTQGNYGVTAQQDADNKVTVVINGSMAITGKHEFTLIAKDEYGATTNKTFEYTVNENNAPELIKEIGTQCINGVGGSISLNINDYVKDVDGGPLSVLTSMSDRNIVSFSYASDVVTFVGKQVGSTEIKLTVTDSKGASVSATFTVLVRDASKLFDIYPNPVTDYLNIRTSYSQECSVNIISMTGSNIYSAQKQIGPDTPLQIDMKSAAPGQYTVSVKMSDGTESRSSVIKL